MFPRNEIAVDYSYAYYLPSTGYSKATNQSLNGGGGAYVMLALLTICKPHTAQNILSAPSWSSCLSQ